MKDTTTKNSQWWEQQSRQRRIFNRLLFTAMLNGCNSAHWQQCEGRFSAIPGKDYQRKITHGLGHARFNIVVRELTNRGLTPGKDYPLNISTDDLNLTINIALKEKANDDPEMLLAWQKIEDPRLLQSISRLIESFPPDRDYRVIRGQVVDHNSLPVAKARITTKQMLDRCRFTSPDGRDAMSYCVLTDADGKFEMPLIYNEEHWREEEIAVIATSDNLKASQLTFREPTEGGDINDLAIKLPKPVELTVNHDLQLDDVVAPLKLFVESLETGFWETRIIQNSGKACFAYLAPAKYLVSIHQMGNDCARQMVDLSDGKTQTLDFGSAQKAELVCEVICARLPSSESRLEFTINATQHSPFESYRQTKDENFEHKRIKLVPNLFQKTDDGRWRFTFPIKNLVGGAYKIEIQINQDSSNVENGWEQYTYYEKSKTILLNGDPPTCETTELEWNIDGEQIWFRLSQT